MTTHIQTAAGRGELVVDEALLGSVHGQYIDEVRLVPLDEQRSWPHRVPMGVRFRLLLDGLEVPLGRIIRTPDNVLAAWVKTRPSPPRGTRVSVAIDPNPEGDLFMAKLVFEEREVDV